MLCDLLEFSLAAGECLCTVLLEDKDGIAEVIRYWIHCLPAMISHTSRPTSTLSLPSLCSDTQRINAIPSTYVSVPSILVTVHSKVSEPNNGSSLVVWNLRTDYRWGGGWHFSADT